MGQQQQDESCKSDVSSQPKADGKVVSGLSEQIKQDEEIAETVLCDNQPDSLDQVDYFYFSRCLIILLLFHLSA